MLLHVAAAAADADADDNAAAGSVAVWRNVIHCEYDEDITEMAYKCRSVKIKTHQCKLTRIHIVIIQASQQLQILLEMHTGSPQKF